MIKILQDRPGGLLNLVAGEHHVHTGVYAVLNLKGQHARVSVQILCFALKTIKTVRVLKVQGGNASHVVVLLNSIYLRVGAPVCAVYSGGNRLRAGLLAGGANARENQIVTVDGKSMRVLDQPDQVVHVVHVDIESVPAS